MITLARVTGQTLNLEFGGTGGISKALLDGKDVTAQISCMKRDDYLEYTTLFGFGEHHEEHNVTLFSHLQKKLSPLGLTIVKVVEDKGVYSVWLAEAEANPVMSKTTMVAEYDSYSQMFKRIGLCIDPKGIHSVSRLNSVL